MNRRGLLVYIALVSFLLCICDAKKKTRIIYSPILRQKETNAIDFIRLVGMRLIYGVAKRFGFQEGISEALNGAFVPPGVEDDYDDYDEFFDDDDDDF